MCEPADPILLLERMPFSLSCFAQTHDKGSYGREQCRLMADGIHRDLDYIVKALKEERQAHLKSLKGAGNA